MQKKARHNKAGRGTNPNDLLSELRRFVDRVGGLMHALNWLKGEYGYIDSSWIPTIAEAFNISQAEVRGVISFYHDFKLKPPAVHTIKICQAEACQSLGARQLTKDIEAKFGTSLGTRTPDNRVELEAIYCLGLCAVGPSVQVDHKLIARATSDSISLSTE
ncbi:MAG: NADH-quinone oxidoreductase subunit E [Gammaproteobacteria bacterium]|nr:NADH-quinone oxidoreductase subunit E [Gammaproteobacteria bacterium]MYF03433.1 NADH-quinone oxidoreductase subunit E [Gammaproteobacteria bacterium]MYI76610.1 NADH-quinone oxidoreductase subunit E [Gammaproteobacteria bacterium]